MNKILLLISVAASIILILPAKITEIIIGILMIPVITVIIQHFITNFFIQSHAD